MGAELRLPYLQTRRVHLGGGPVRRDGAQGADENLHFLPAALGLGQPLQVPLEQAQHLSLRLKGLDDGKASQTVLQGGGIGFVLPGDILFRLGHLVSRENGGDERQKGQTDGRQGQLRAVPKHQPHGSHKGQKALHQGKDVFQIPLLNGGNVVGEGGYVGGGAFCGEGADVLFRQLLKDFGLVLADSPGVEAGDGKVIDEKGKNQHSQHTQGDEEQLPQGEAGLIAPHQVQQLLQKPGNHQGHQGHKQGAYQSRKKGQPVAPIKLFCVGTNIRFHCIYSFQPLFVPAVYQELLLSGLNNPC